MEKIRTGQQVRINPDYISQLTEGRLRAAVLLGEVLPVCDVEHWGPKGRVATFKIDGCEQGIPVEHLELV